MKKFVAIVSLIVVILTLTPPLLGMQTQTRLEEGLNQATRQTNGLIDFSLEDFNRGWFSSRGKIRFKFSEAFLQANPMFQQTAVSGADPATGFTQDIAIDHGPLLLGQHMGMGLGEVVLTLDGADTPALAALLAETGNPYLLRASMFIGFTGMGDITIDAPAFKFTQTEKAVEAIVFAGANATGNFDSDDTHLVMQGQMNGFSITGKQGEAVIERITFNTDMAYPETDPYGLGFGALALDRLVALSDDQTTLDMRQASLRFSSVKDSVEKISVSITYAFDTLAIADLVLSDMELSLELTNLDPAALTKIRNLSMSLSPQPSDAQQIFTQFIGPAYELLASGVSLRMDPIRFIYDGQPFEATVKLQSKPANLPPRDAFTLDNPLMFLDLFSLEIDLSVDQSLALKLALPQLTARLAAGVPQGTEIDDTQLEELARAQAPLILGTLVGQGILRKDGTNYVVTARYDDGKLLVNGNPLPLGALTNP